MRYTMLICGPDDDWDAEDTDGVMEKIYAWFARWEPEGKIAKGGVELDAPRKARTIRSGPDGPVVTDGPYLELKEVIGGIVFLDVANLDEAVAIASTWPLSGTTSIEVRPVIEH